jgi:hypothetical protein
VKGPDQAPTRRGEGLLVDLLRRPGTHDGSSVSQAVIPFASKEGSDVAVDDGAA